MEMVSKLSWSAVRPALAFGLLFLVFYEIYRYYSLLSKLPPGPKPWPLVGNLPSLVKEPFKFIDEGIEVFMNLTSILSDEDHWKYPYTFNPDNFLDDQGQFYKHESFIAFSVGPRVCLGEQLARMELFINFTSLLQRLRFSWPPGADPPRPEGRVWCCVQP